MLNAIQTALQNSAVVFADNQEIDLYLERVNAYAFAASNNLEIDITNETAAADTARVLGEREIKIAEFNATGRAVAGTYLSLGNLITGTNTPQPTATTVDEVYHNGRTQTRRTGVTNGAPTWTIAGYDSDPEIALLLAYAPIDKNNLTGKEGRPLAYLSYNGDRSFFAGKLSIISAYERGTDTNAWVFTVTFEAGKYHASSQNPAAGSVTTPQATQLSPDTGPVGTTVTVRGLNLNTVSAVRFGPSSITALGAQTATEFTFAVPVGSTGGPKTVTLVFNTDDESPAGTFTVTV